MISPWFVFIVDLAIFAALLSFRHRPQIAYDYEPGCSSVKSATGTVSALLFQLAIAAVLVTVTGFAEKIFTSPGLRGGLVRGGASSFLTPKKLIGEPFPAMSEITSDANLSRGRWLLVFYQTRCGACQTTVSAYKALAELISNQPNGTKLALIQLLNRKEGLSDQVNRGPTAKSFAVAARIKEPTVNKQLTYGVMAYENQPRIPLLTAVLVHDSVVTDVFFNPSEVENRLLAKLSR